jgi:hypothetical protein
MRLQSVQVSHDGYRQWVCDTCGHHGIPLPIRR